MSLVKKEKQPLDKITNLILNEIDFSKKMERRVLEEQERTWIVFNFYISPKTKKKIPLVIKEKCDLNVKWENQSLIIEFFAGDELAEIRHRKSLTKEIIPKLKEEKNRKKRREKIPEPSSEKHFHKKKYQGK